MDSNHFNGGYNPYQGNPQNLAPQNPSQQSSAQQQQQQQPGLASFGSLSAQSQQQGQQQQQSPSHPTLPPLQNQNGYSFGSLSYSHPGSQSQTPTTPHTPQQSNMPGANQSAYGQMPGGAGGNMLPPSGLSNPYSSVSQGMMYPSSVSTSMPPTTSAAGLPTLRPMPAGGVSGVNGLPSLASAGHMAQMGQQPSFMQNEEAPTHVVGSQGRRGVLPSAPGRPPPAQGATATKSMIPQKDADGKYPCPHCNKTYLHAKHLKRHLLRHTGDRPYMCHLCKDTFSRSDILKRHFQKCSLRRGNPTGANHLAHQRRNTNNGNRLSISQQEGPVGLAGMPDVSGSSTYNANVVGSSPNVNGDLSARSSRANSLIGGGAMSHRNSLAGLGILGSNAPHAEQMQQGTSAPYQPGLNAYSMQNTTNGAQMPSGYQFNQQQMNGNPYSNAQNQQPMSFLGHQSSRFDNSQVNSHPQLQSGDGSGVDWNRMFTQNGQDGFIGSHSANASSQGNIHIKTEPDTKHDFSTHNDFNNDSFLGSLYSHPGGFGSEETDQGMPGFPNWSMDDPLQAKVDSLMHHCFPQGVDAAQPSPAAQLVQTVLKIENVKHFAEHYTSYQGHWPILHMPTFKLTDANNNLVLAILCIGAVYSPKFTVHQTRQLMEFVKAIVFSNCTIYNRTLSGHIEGLGEQPFEVEELQALSMLQTMFIWHGDPTQRQGARDEFPTLVRIAKAMNLYDTASPSHYAYSMLHSGRNSQANQYRVENWNWHGWLEQEKRNRALYQLLVTDAAMVMYFNSTPQFDPLEIRLMLPADDAAWDAANAHECSNVLGLSGPDAQNKNMTGTRKPIQPTMRDAMRTLLDQYASFQPGTTNVYSKFMLIHALIIRIIVCQKALLQPDGGYHDFKLGLNGSTPATPLSQNDWLEQHGGGSASNSGHATPTGGFSPKQQQNLAAQQEKKRLGQALEKWKRNWDTDMELQYPPHHYQQRRFGFSRDGVHFFYLGRSFLQSQQASDFNVPGDVRFRRVMALLKRIKSMVVGDNETKGQDIGSVGDIDDQYGLDNLTLDMKLLFRPYNSLVDSPVAGV
ncbi:Zinc finger and BTB domain-containing protein 7B [Pseudocercospora fuligena]|uniref:Zinc finger and BTB domain-containing protein 7B n=1 Tax=Pseudocercospora fuligena TaxID=685502 RepID=A0A8H6VTP7_9PEZI|nr:Zinc finger and BTB domain-containing protein 7B [Pseudocercospora fuligena]